MITTILIVVGLYGGWKARKKYDEWRHGPDSNRLIDG